MVTHNYPDSSITILAVNKPNLFKFFQIVNERVFYNSINIIYLEPYRTRRAKAKGKNKRVFRILSAIIHTLPDIVKERRSLKEMLNKYFAELEGCEIFFSGRAMSGYLFYLLKKLSKKNRLVYITPDPPDMIKYTPTNIVDLADFIIRKLTYGFDIAMGKLPYYEGFPYMPDKFVEKRVDRIIDWEEKNEMLKDFDLSQFRVFDVGKYSVIFFDQSPILNRYPINENTYRRELTEIFDILSKYFPEEEIARKYHPNYPADKTMPKVGDVLPDFIPAEFLYDDNVKIYLGLFSTSICMVEKGLAVSIANLISFEDEKFREWSKERLIQSSHSEILFPESLDEFEGILIGLKE